MRMGRIGIQSQLRRALSIAARLLRQADTARIDDVLLCLSSTDGSNALTREPLFRGCEHLPDMRHCECMVSPKCLGPMDIENMKSTAKLVKVDLAFLFQLADMTVDSETSAELQTKAFAAYQAPHKAVAADYETRGSARKADGSPAYRLQAIAGLAEPRDGAKVFALWFSSAEDFTRAAKNELTALCGQCVFDAAYERRINSVFYGARQCRKFETVEWADIM